MHYRCANFAFSILSAAAEVPSTDTGEIDLIIVSALFRIVKRFFQMEEACQDLCLIVANWVFGA
ncbi:MAG: hypothetical protein IKG97_06175, partial [Lachnospiraceae bacterium]|nr:hypothetical protein [Lachnospiraceae bacterium]